MSESVLLDPNDIEPPHEAHDEPLLAQLVENMKRDGWERRRRRLLVEDITLRLGPRTFLAMASSSAFLLSSTVITKHGTCESSARRAASIR